MIDDGGEGLLAGEVVEGVPVAGGQHCQAVGGAWTVGGSRGVGGCQG